MMFEPECPVCEVKRDIEDAMMHRVSAGQLVEIDDVFTDTGYTRDGIYASAAMVSFREIDGYHSSEWFIKDLRPLTHAAAELLSVAKESYHAWWQEKRDNEGWKEPTRTHGFPNHFRPVPPRIYKET
jgi:hypothetical protein